MASLTVSPRQFAGVSCTWHAAGSSTADRQLFGCTEQQQPHHNQTAARTAEALGSLQIPASLYYQLGLMEKDLLQAVGYVCEMSLRIKNRI